MYQKCNHFVRAVNMNIWLIPRLWHTYIYGFTPKDQLISDMVIFIKHCCWECDGSYEVTIKRLKIITSKTTDEILLYSKYVYESFTRVYVFFGQLKLTIFAWNFSILECWNHHSSIYWFGIARYIALLIRI